MTEETTAAPAPEAEELLSDDMPDAGAETSQDEELGAVFDKLHDGDSDEGDEAEPEAPAVELPSDLPKALHAHWATMSEEARQAVTASHRELSNKLAEQGRQYEGMKPLRDGIAEIAQEFPEIKDMSTKQFLGEMRELARVSKAIAQDPVNAIVGVIQQHGLFNALSAYFAQGPQSGTYVAQMEATVRKLEKQLSEATDPNKLRQNFQAWTAEDRTVAELNEVASQNEHYAAVEKYLPQLIPIAREKLPPNAPAKAVLSAAYEMALREFLPGKAMPPKNGADPEKLAAAKKATSVNVSGRGTGKPRQMTEDELLSAAFDKAQRH